MYEQPVVAAVFAALACGTVILSVAVRGRYWSADRHGPSGRGGRRFKSCHSDQ